MLQTIDPTVSSYNAGQALLAYVVVALILAAAAVVLYRLRYTGLDETARQVKSRVETQLTRQTPGTVRLDPDGDPSDRRGDIRAAFASAGAVEETTSVTEAAGAVTDALLETYRPLAERLPPLARKLLGLAVLVLTLGALAVSADSIIAAMQSSSSLDPVRYWPGAAARDAVAIADRVLSLPILGTAGTLVFAYAILLAEWLYTHYWVVAAILGIVAVRIATARDADGEVPGYELPAPRAVAGRAVLIVLVLATGVLGTSGLGRALFDSKLIGRQAATVVAVGGIGLAVVGLGYGVVRLVRPLRADWAARDGRGRVLVLARVLGIGVAALGAPLLPAWGVAAAFNLPRILAALASASTGVQATVALLGLALLAGLAYVVRQAAGDLRTALGEVAARNGVRVSLGARALPVGVLGLVYLVGLGLGAPWWTAATMALVAALVARALWSVAQRMRYRAQVAPESDPGASRVVVHAYELDTPAGTQWFARVNGDPVAHPVQARAVDAVIEAARDWFADGQQHPSLASAHADELREEGVSEIAETRRRLRSRVRERAEGQVRSEGMLEREELEDDLADDFPAEVWRPELRQLRARGPLAEREGYLFAD